MPVITITMGKEQATNAQKKDLIENFTKEAMRITQLPEQAFTILIHELASTAIGVAGQTLAEMHTTADS